MASFEDKIRAWVKTDDELRRSQEITKRLREKRNQIAGGIHNYVASNELNNATVNISDGRIKFVKTQIPQSLTFKFIEECLSDIITNTASVEQIMAHIKSRRSMRLTQDIKRFYSDN
jgi:hypothetical protein